MIVMLTITITKLITQRYKKYRVSQVITRYRDRVANRTIASKLDGMLLTARTRKPRVERPTHFAPARDL